MRIDRVSYAQLFNLGNLENERIELSAQIDDPAYWEGSLQTLREMVEAVFLQHAEERCTDKNAASREHGAKARLDDMERALAVAQHRLNSLNEILVKHGVSPVDPAEYEDIPF